MDGIEIGDARSRSPGRTSPPDAPPCTPSRSRPTGSTSTTASPAPTVPARARARAKPRRLPDRRHPGRHRAGPPGPVPARCPQRRRRAHHQRSRARPGGSVHDLTEPVGRLSFDVSAMVAEFESDLIDAHPRGPGRGPRRGRGRGRTPELTTRHEQHLVQLDRADDTGTADLAELVRGRAVHGPPSRQPCRQPTRVTTSRRRRACGGGERDDRPADLHGGSSSSCCGHARPAAPRRGQRGHPVDVAAAGAVRS